MQTSYVGLFVLPESVSALKLNICKKKYYESVLLLLSIAATAPNILIPTDLKTGQAEFILFIQMSCLPQDEEERALMMLSMSSIATRPTDR